MRTVAYIASTPLPSLTANSIQVVRMCSAMRRSGCDLTLYVPVFGADRPPTDIFSHYGVVDRFSLMPIGVPRVRGATHMFAASAAWHARRVAEIAYTRSAEAAFYATSFGLTTIFEAHAPVEAFRPVQRWMLARVLRSRRLLRLVVISEYLRRSYSRLTQNLEMLVAHDAADAPAERPVSRAGAGPLRVCYAGSLYRGRGVNLLVELAARCPWAVFHIYGGPPEAAATLRRQTAAVTNMSFHGPVSPAQIAGVIADCDVLLAPYEAAVFTGTNRIETSRWMSPLKVFEYMAAGRPIVCSDLPAIREVLEDGVTALLRPPGDVEAWVAALVALRDSEELRRRLGDAAFETLRRSHTWDARARQVLSDMRI